MRRRTSFFKRSTFSCSITTPTCSASPPPPSELPSAAAAEFWIARHHAELQRLQREQQQSSNSSRSHLIKDRSSMGGKTRNRQEDEATSRKRPIVKVRDIDHRHSSHYYQKFPLIKKKRISGSCNFSTRPIVNFLVILDPVYPGREHKNSLPSRTNSLRR